MAESTTVNNNKKSDNRSNTTQHNTTQHNSSNNLQTQTLSWTRNNTLFLENSLLWSLFPLNATYLPP
jgi:hypothetical protein